MSSEPAPSASSALDPEFERPEPQLLEPVRFGDRERLESQVGQSGSAPQCQCGPEVARGLPRIAAGEVLAAQRKQPLEVIEVQLVGHDLGAHSRAPAAIRDRLRASCAASRCSCRACGQAVGGGRSPQMPSISWSRETAVFAFSSRIARSARCLGPPSGKSSLSR